ncbi:MAG: cysteine-rich CWC family protein [Methylobacteriaceae bacterium]|nr:cysteine-rich CWC family protein [Methylobacteriaceae bacterium]
MAQQLGPYSRRIACSRCGVSFGCTNDGSGRCWCGAEPYRLPRPLPAEAGTFEDCLCPRCLRETAASLAHLAPGAAPR